MCKKTELSLFVIWLPLAIIAQTNTIRIEGAYGYTQTDTDLTLRASRVVNYRSFGSTSGTLRLSLWASEARYTGGTIYGWRLGSVTLGTLRGGYEFTNINITTTLLTIPPIGGQYYLTMLLEEWSGSQYLIENYAGFDERLRTWPLELNGTVTYNLISPGVIRLTADTLLNPRTSSNTSGTIRLELWALPSPYQDLNSLNNGYLMAASVHDPLQGGWQDNNISRDVSFTKPPTGNYFVAMIVREYMFEAYRVQTWRNFSTKWEFLPVTNSIVIQGSSGWYLNDNQLTITVATIANQYAPGTAGINLKLSAWASDSPYHGGTLKGWRLVGFDLGSLAGNSKFTNISRTGQLLAEPPPGEYYTILTVEGQTGGQYFLEAWANSATKLFFFDSLWNDFHEVNGWLNGWFGWFQHPATGWIYYLNIGFVYVSASTQQSIWLYYPQSNLGWVWTNKIRYPFMYSEKLGWIYHYTDSNWFKNIQANQYFEIKN